MLTVSRPKLGRALIIPPPHCELSSISVAMGRMVAVTEALQEPMPEAGSTHEWSGVFSALSLGF
jgi:hypothetical protein